AHDTDAADQLVRAAVDEDAVYNQRNHLERLRRTALGDGKAGRDVLKVKSVGFALLPGFLNQLLAQFSLRLGLGGRDDEVALASGGHVAALRAPVPVRL